MRLWWDLETYSETPINDGAHRYAENAEILLFAWAVDDGPVQCWDCSDGYSQMPGALWSAIQSADEYWGHNSGGFDRTVMRHAMKHVYSEMPEHMHRDTMVQALCHGLPGSLSALCDIFRLDSDVAKDKRGKQLIRMFCMPQPANQKLRRKTRETHPAEWAEFIEYAKSDITSMRILHQKMPKWNYPNHEFELRLWQMDQRINNGGIYVDLELSEKAVEAVNAAQAQLASDVSEATNGEVASATQRDALLKHILNEHGVSLPDMRSDTLERRLMDPSLPDGVRDLLAIRLMASTSSVSKYKRVMRCTSSDGYLRGVIQFSGAGRTGRDAGRLFQPQNLMRPTLEAAEIETGIEAIKAGCADLVTDNVMELCANAMRGVIIAPPKSKIVVADLSNIEGRVGAWAAGEEWKIKAFYAFDAGTGPDLYKLTYSRSFFVPVETVDGEGRKRGKVQDLAFQFGGGVGSWATFAAVYSIDLDQLAEEVKEQIPAEIWDEACGFLEWSIETKRPRFGMSDDVYRVCDSLKRVWRREHPAIAAVWKRLENASRNAIEEEGVEFPVGVVRLVRKGNWLRMILPSGRSVSYPAPRVSDNGTISYMGLNQYSRKWQRLTTYGGKIFENLCQAIARDVFKSAYPAIIAEGYRPVLPVHDELLTYTPDGLMYNAKHLSQLMATNPSWAQGLPLAAAGFEAYRYRKD